LTNNAVLIIFEGERAMKDTQEKITKVCDEIKALLLEKNKRYGDSALNPLCVFSGARLGAEDSICIRLDDKIKRIMNSQEHRKNDIADLIGYLILLCCSKEWVTFNELID
jgi:hypothetical protein